MDLACIGHFNPKNITVRSKSRDLLSTDRYLLELSTNLREVIQCPEKNNPNEITNYRYSLLYL